MIMNVQQNAGAPAYQPPAPAPAPVVIQEKKSNTCCIVTTILICLCIGVPLILFLTLVVFATAAVSEINDHLATASPPPGWNSTYSYSTYSYPSSSSTPAAFATSFTSMGSIDSSTVDICAGDNEYSVSSGGTFESPNYPSPYNNDAACTNKFTSSSDGITFAIVNFHTEAGYDELTFRGDDATEYAFTGFVSNSTRFSFSSSYVEAHFSSDYAFAYSGFQIDVIDGYEPSNEVSMVWPNVRFTGEKPPKEE
ncbi:Oidioi.mRNA.OKI2018_I69.chr1.g43.t1.cds [Oikopleura dioica]|uniref:Oidioi.mRNA.OKI2018_I69.chr1.g43.t1.cds n=1 Tax=Oikopleura dioica TaxID=34765 RepID=A0ABN7SNT0_OIKDI|nr:Oidioi.mRNA.OKI2018_I69.chr1.g43.t1.cds [Oikopleura dioica]